MSDFIKVISPGLLTTIQDMGRKGYQKYGVPVSGAMDMSSAKLANSIVNNPIKMPLIEITNSGPKLLFECNTVIAITGADISPKVNDIEIKLNRAVAIRKKDILSFQSIKYGSRCYLSVQGGLKTEKILGSYSFFNNITKNSSFYKGMKITINKPTALKVDTKSNIRINKTHFDSLEIEALPGPEFESLSKEQIKKILKQSFSISKHNNRMGYQLNENLPANKNTSMISSAVIPGVVQLTPSGKLIILMRDCQTTGGYPRILQLTEKAIDKLSQKKTNDKIQFKFVDYKI